MNLLSRLLYEQKLKADQDKLSDALVKLSDEDPTFEVKVDEETGQTLISGMGELHLEILSRQDEGVNLKLQAERPGKLLG